MANVSPGDLARVVAPYALPGRGAFVKVLRAAAAFERLNGRAYAERPGLSGWVCEGLVRDEQGVVHGPLLVIADCCLRRVNPGDAEDEILRLVGKPEPTAQPQPIEA